MQHLNEVHADMQDRQAAQENQQLAEAEQVARGMVADEFRAAGAGRVDIDVGLEAAGQVADMQIQAWRQAGYTDEQISEMETPEFAAWAIRTAAEFGRQAQISDFALRKV